jgi:hypothetical protein
MQASEFNFTSLDLPIFTQERKVHLQPLDIRENGFEISRPTAFSAMFGQQMNVPLPKKVYSFGSLEIEDRPEQTFEGHIIKKQKTEEEQKQGVKVKTSSTADSSVKPSPAEPESDESKDYEPDYGIPSKPSIPSIDYKKFLKRPLTDEDIGLLNDFNEQTEEEQRQIEIEKENERRLLKLKMKDGENAERVRKKKAEQEEREKEIEQKEQQRRLQAIREELKEEQRQIEIEKENERRLLKLKMKDGENAERVRKKKAEQEEREKDIQMALEETEQKLEKMIKEQEERLSRRDKIRAKIRELYNQNLDLIQNLEDGKREELMDLFDETFNLDQLLNDKIPHVSNSIENLEDWKNNLIALHEAKKLREIKEQLQREELTSLIHKVRLAVTKAGVTEEETEKISVWYDSLQNDQSRKKYLLTLLEIYSRPVIESSGRGELSRTDQITQLPPIDVKNTTPPIDVHPSLPIDERSPRKRYTPPSSPSTEPNLSPPPRNKRKWMRLRNSPSRPSLPPPQPMPEPSSIELEEKIPTHEEYNDVLADFLAESVRDIQNSLRSPSLSSQSSSSPQASSPTSPDHVPVIRENRRLPPTRSPPSPQASSPSPQASSPTYPDHVPVIRENRRLPPTRSPPSPQASSPSPQASSPTYPDHVPVIRENRRLPPTRSPPQSFELEEKFPAPENSAWSSQPIERRRPVGPYLFNFLDGYTPQLPSQNIESKKEAGSIESKEEAGSIVYLPFLPYELLHDLYANRELDKGYNFIKVSDSFMIPFHKYDTLASLLLTKYPQYEEQIKKAIRYYKKHYPNSFTLNV